MRPAQNQNQPPPTPWQRTLTIMFFAQVVTSIAFSSIFPFLPLYIGSLERVTRAGTELFSGMVFSSTAFTMMLASPVWGRLADRWGRKIMVERAMFGGAVVLGMMAFVRTAEELVLLRALQGTVTGTIGAANALVAAVVPRERTGYAMGLMQVGMGLGVGVGPIIGGLVADAYGYRAAFYVTAFLLTLAGVIVFFWVAEDFQPLPPTDGKPPGLWAAWREILSPAGVMVTYCLRFLNQMGRVIFIPILPLFAVELMADPDRVNSFTGLVIGSAAAATTLSAVYLGRLGDRIGHRRIIVCSSLICAIFFFLQCGVTAGWQLLALQAVVGTALGGIVPGVSALLAIYTRRGDEGSVYGLDNSIVSGARVVGPMLGVAVAMWVGFRAVFAFASLLYLVTGIIAALALPPPLPPNRIVPDDRDSAAAPGIREAMANPKTSPPP